MTDAQFKMLVSLDAIFRKHGRFTLNPSSTDCLVEVLALFNAPFAREPLQTIWRLITDIAPFDGFRHDAAINHLLPHMRSLISEPELAEFLAKFPARSSIAELMDEVALDFTTNIEPRLPSDWSDRTSGAPKARTPREHPSW
jgi:hypothetical protein